MLGNQPENSVSIPETLTSDDLTELPKPQDSQHLSEGSHVSSPTEETRSKSSVPSNESPQPSAESSDYLNPAQTHRRLLNDRADDPSSDMGNRPSSYSVTVGLSQYHNQDSYMLDQDRGYHSEGDTVSENITGMSEEPLHTDDTVYPMSDFGVSDVFVQNTKPPSAFQLSEEHQRAQAVDLSLTVFSPEDLIKLESECVGQSPMNFLLTGTGHERSARPALPRGLFLDDPPIRSSSPSIASSARDELSLLEWIAMLTSVLSGDVVGSEHVRLTTWLKSTDQSHLSNDRNLLWLSIRAYLARRSIDDERRRLHEGRSQMESVLQDVMNFSVKENTVSMYDQVETILANVDSMEELYPSRHAMITQHPQYGSHATQHRLDALLSWISISKSIKMKLRIIKEWTGCDLREGSFEEENRLKSAEFVNMMSKNAAVKGLFTTGVLRTLHLLLNKVKNVMIEYIRVFERLGLYTFTDELERLAAFPSDLMLEILKTRVACGDALSNLSGMVADQVIDDVRENMQLAIQILQEGRQFYQPMLTLSIVNRLSPKYESYLLGTLKLYLKLLGVRIANSSDTRLLLITEKLETQWEFSKSMCHGIKGGAMECAAQFCTLEMQLLEYTAKQVKVVARRVAVESGSSLINLVKAHLRLLEVMKTSLSAVMRLLRSLSASTSNSVEYKVHDYDNLINLMVLTGHFLVEFTEGSASLSNMAVIASPNATSSSTITSILDWCVVDPSVQRAPNEFGHYIVALSLPSSNFVWPGMILTVSSYEFPDTLLRTGHALVITEGAGHIEESRQRFENTAAETVEVCSEPRPFHCRPQQELSRCRRALIKLLNRFKRVIHQLREQLRALIVREANTVLDVNPRALASNVIGDLFCFVAELAHKAIRSMIYPTSSITRALTSFLVAFVGDWIDFCSRDCEHKSRRTLRWCLQALDFAQMVAVNPRIDTLRPSEFTHLKAFVARGMSLLIKHIDVQGLRFRPGFMQDRRDKYEGGTAGFPVNDTPTSTLRDLKAAGAEHPSPPKRLIKTFDLDTSPCRRLANSYSEILAKIELARDERESSWRLIGKVLDEASSERERVLKQIVSDIPQFDVNWQLGKFLGGGSFGTVSVAINLDNSELMAVKEIRFPDTKSLLTLEKSVREEMACLRQLSHPNTVGYFGVEVRRDKLYIFMEYCPHSLSSLLHHGRIEDQRVLKMFVKQLLKGLEYLHSKGIVHRDIKPANILIGSDGQIKYVDFGASKIYKSTVTIPMKTGKSSLVGTASYLAPEVIAGHAPGALGSQDIWSLGCCVLEMVTGQMPWCFLENDWAILYHIGVSNCTPPLPGPALASRDCRDFLEKCFARPASTRPTAATMLKHPWIASMAEDEYEITMLPSARAVIESDDTSFIEGGLSHPSGMTRVSEDPSPSRHSSHQRPPLFKPSPKRISDDKESAVPTNQDDAKQRVKKRLSQSFSLPLL